MRKAAVLTVPGLGGSVPNHWQTLWEHTPDISRVEQRDWDDPVLADWVARLDRAVTQAKAPVVLVAHSLGVALVNHWARRAQGHVKGALLVAPADVDAKDHPPEAQRFGPRPLAPLPFPSVVVASENDPFVSLERARYFADVWGSRFVNVGRLGHINADSGLGRWADGFALVDELQRDAAP